HGLAGLQPGSVCPDRPRPTDRYLAGHTSFPAPIHDYYGDCRRHDNHSYPEVGASRAGNGPPRPRFVPEPSFPHTSSSRPPIASSATNSYSNLTIRNHMIPASCRWFMTATVTMWRIFTFIPISMVIPSTISLFSSWLTRFPASNQRSWLVSALGQAQGLPLWDSAILGEKWRTSANTRERGRCA